MSEMTFAFLLILLSSQSNSLWTSITILPISVASIFFVTSYENVSGALMFLYLMVFIGGLLVLLVSVASISLQDQSSNMKIYDVSFVILLVPLLLEKSEEFNTMESMMTNFTWVLNSSLFSNMILMMLLLSITVLSMLMQIFKGMVRSI